MKRSFGLFVAAMFILHASPNIAAERGVLIHNGFGTGQDFLGFSDVGKRAYAMGVINGFIMAPMFGAPEAQVFRFGRCLENMTDVQVAAIIDKWLREHPERWHYGLHDVSWDAVTSVCGIK
jgi:hypothetical protein